MRHRTTGSMAYVREISIEHPADTRIALLPNPAAVGEVYVFKSINQSIYLNQERTHRTIKTVQKNMNIETSENRQTDRQTDRQRKCN